MTQPDVVLIHPPSIFDFRDRTIFYGPISDVIPSTPIFEMYPIGFATLAAYLRRHGYRTRIVNLALRMMRSRRFDVERFLSRFHPKLFGIDLHWLPHAQGGPEVAKLLKRLHPDIPIVFGGISSSYFHEELIRDPAVDFVLRGSVTEPCLLALVRELEGERHFERVPNLTWKDDGEVRVNPASFAPPALDRVRARRRDDDRVGGRPPGLLDEHSLPRLVAAPDHGGAHRARVRARLRDLRRVERRVQSLHAGAPPAAPGPGRDRVADPAVRLVHPRPRIPGGRHQRRRGGVRARRGRGDRPPPGVQSHHLRILRAPAGRSPAAHRRPDPPLGSRTLPRKPRRGPPRPARQGPLHECRSRGGHRPHAGPPLRESGHVLHGRAPGADATAT